MNVGKKKVDWVMADGTKYTAKKAAALTRLAKRAKEGGGAASPEREEKDKDENNHDSDDDDNEGEAGSHDNGSSSNSSNGNGSSAIAEEATKAFVKITKAIAETTTTATGANGGGLQVIVTSTLPGA